jgi:cytochrome c peroxidase
MKKSHLGIIVFTTSLVACNGKSNSSDESLSYIINERGLTGDVMAGRNIPSIDSPKAQLGMRLFFFKSLGGDRDSACVTCHHPIWEVEIIYHYQWV